MARHAAATNPAGVSVVSKSEHGPQRGRASSITTHSEEARSAFERGLELHESARHAEARRSFERAVGLDPDFALAHAYLAYLENDRDAKRRHVDRAVQLAAPLPEAERLLAKGMAARALGDLDAERAVYDELRALPLHDHRVAMWLGHAARRFGDEDGALAAFERAVKIAPRAAEPYNELAYAALHAGEYESAVELAHTYARLKPGEPNPQDSLGEILMRVGRFDEAEAAFRKAIEIDPSFFLSYEGLALSHAYRGEWEPAVSAMKTALAGTNAPAMKIRCGRGLVWMKLGAGRAEAALAQVDELRAVAKEHPGAVDAAALELLRVEVLFAAGNYRAAREAAAELAKQCSSTCGFALVLRGAAEIELGQLTKAKRTVSDLAKYVETSGAKRGDVASALARAMLAMADGDAAAAVRDLETVAVRERLAFDGETPYFYQAGLLRVRALDALDRADEAAALRDTLADAATRSSYRAFARWQQFGRRGME